MSDAKRTPPAPEIALEATGPGTYALILELREARELEVGRLGLLRYEPAIYLYFGSAFGPGGLRARLGHHLRPTRRAHWHIDFLRREASVTGIWVTRDPRRLECAWSGAASALRGVKAIPGFGSSDCRCRSHLVALPAVPTRAAFRRHLRHLVPTCARITEAVATRR